MSKVDTESEDVQEFLNSSEPSRDPEYLAWREAKIRTALAADRADSRKATPQQKIWKKFGLEY
ncbi:MAG: hypothetical protein WD767_13965 [Alphaproteobacteria bacterium]